VEGIAMLKIHTISIWVKLATTLDRSGTARVIPDIINGDRSKRIIKDKKEQCGTDFLPFRFTLVVIRATSNIKAKYINIVGAA
jgi:hypothetical protein